MKQPAVRAANSVRRPGAVRFAAALFARHDLYHSARGVERVLRCGPRARAVHFSNQWFSLRIAPLVRLTLSEWSAAPVDSRMAPSGTAATPADTARVTVYRGVERLLQRLLHTKTQLSTAPGTMKTRTRLLEARELDLGRRADRTASPEVQQATRVLRQPAAKTPTIPAARGPAAPPNIEMQRRPQSDSNERFGKRPQPVLDLVRMRHDLTREVVRTLDQRAVAHRERLGRN